MEWMNIVLLNKYAVFQRSVWNIRCYCILVHSKMPFSNCCTRSIQSLNLYPKRRSITIMILMFKSMVPTRVQANQTCSCTGKKPQLHTRTDLPSRDCRLKLTGTAQRQHMLAVRTPLAPFVSSALFIPDCLASQTQSTKQQVSQSYSQGHTKVALSKFWWCEPENSLLECLVVKRAAVFEQAGFVCWRLVLLSSWTTAKLRQIDSTSALCLGFWFRRLLSPHKNSVKRSHPTLLVRLTGMQNESQACGDPQHPEASMTYRTSSPQTWQSATDLTEWRRTLINFLFTRLPNQTEMDTHRKTQRYLWCNGLCAVSIWRSVDETFWENACLCLQIGLHCLSCPFSWELRLKQL